MDNHVAMREQVRFYRKAFPYHFLRTSQSCRILRAAVSLVPAVLLWAAPVRKRVKLPVGLFIMYRIWTEFGKRFPLKVQAAYERYVEKLQGHPSYHMVWFPDMKMEQVQGEDRTMTIVKARGAGLDLLEFTDEAVNLEDGRPRYWRDYQAMGVKRRMKKEGTGNESEH